MYIRQECGTCWSCWRVIIRINPIRITLPQRMTLFPSSFACSCIRMKICFAARNRAGWPVDSIPRTYPIVAADTKNIRHRHEIIANAYSSTRHPRETQGRRLRLHSIQTLWGEGEEDAHHAEFVTPPGGFMTEDCRFHFKMKNKGTPLALRKY